MKLDQIYNEDCLVGMQQIPDASVDCILSDLPYGTTKCRWDSVIPFEPLWTQYKRVAKKSAAVVLFGTEPFASHLRLSNLSEYRYDWTWNKVTARGHLVAKYRPLQQTECITVFSKNAPRYFPQMTKRPKNKVTTSREYTRTEVMGGKTSSLAKLYDHWHPKTILEFSNAHSSGSSVHPTQKPVALFEYLIRTYTNEGETVLDTCMGSGTTAIACINTNRHYIGFEKDAKYFVIAQKRVSEHKPQLQLIA